jgi:hypothetical protein
VLSTLWEFAQSSYRAEAEILDDDVKHFSFQVLEAGTLPLAAMVAL